MSTTLKDGFHTLHADVLTTTRAVRHAVHALSATYTTTYTRLKSRCPLPQFRVSRPCAWGSSPCVGTAREDGPLEGHWSRFNPKRAACYYRTSGKHGYLVPHSAWRERGSRRRGQQCGPLRESSDMSPRWTQTGVLIQPPMDTDGSPDTAPDGPRRES